MATKYVTLKDSNGDTLYPQAVATNLAPGSIDTTELADGAVTGAKIDWPTAAKNSYSTGNRFTSVQSGQTVNLLSTTYTSKTGRVAVLATAPIYTSRYTSFVQILVGGVSKTSAVTNKQTYTGATTVVWTGDIGTSPVTISSVATAQDSGTTVYVESYSSYELLIMDV